MTGRYVRTGSERLLRVHGHPTSQEEMRFNAEHTQVKGETLVERGEAASILVLLDLLEATQDTLEFQRTLINKAEATAEAAGRLCYEVAAS
jgi:hypothetical protein